MAPKNKRTTIAVETPEVENHMQVFRRLDLASRGEVFAHGTPQPKVKKTH